MAEKFVVFEDAVAELNMSAADLKALADEGKIRTFMDGGKIKFRRGDLDELKASMGMGAGEEEELTLAPSEDVPPAPPMEGAGEIPPPPPAEDDFSIEPLDEAPPEPLVPPPPATEEAGEEEEEIASLSDFEISGAVEEEGVELGEEEAELLSVQTPGFRSYEEPQSADIVMTVVLVAAIVVVVFAAVTIMSFAWDVNPFPSLTSIWPK